jgi:GNAT superfamily N-acetyltransferase
MMEVEYELRRPRSDEEWRAFHALRRRVLFENRGKGESYVENHPDDSQPGNHPLVLLYREEIIGVMRLDVAETIGWLRRVAIREDLQRVGHGRVLLKLAEAFARAQDCDELRTNAAVEAVGFYERCGYERDLEALSPPNSVRMWQRLTHFDHQ